LAIAAFAKADGESLSECWSKRARFMSWQMVWHPSGVRFILRIDTGGLRCAATSGYSLATLRVACGGRGSVPSYLISPET
jgi:hypothetical protein